MEGRASVGQRPPGQYEMREIVNALLYQSRTGCQWDFLPHDLPPRSAVFYYFARWRDDGTDQAIHDLLRWQTREKKGRLADPSLAVLDTQRVHAAAGVPADTTGKDAGKKVPGRKRGLAVDVLGPVIAVVVLAASAHENIAGTALLDRLAIQAPTVHKVLVDQGCKSSVVTHGARLGMDVEIVARNPADRGFVPQPKRWVAEQTLGGRADLRHPHAAPPAGTRLRTPPGQFRIAGVLGDERCDDQTPDRHRNPDLARRMTTSPDPGTWLLVKIDAREAALTSQAEHTRALISDLTAKLRDLDELSIIYG
ncbi:IS5 family transposase [Nonomuraea deserti]|uniref:IS5 family transposase n=1 Tax=Nonomuraea deserti TaxID=1848322 RepID=UPI002482C83C|nr:IS5 family transposase [Nonomuraea deserti]